MKGQVIMVVITLVPASQFTVEGTVRPALLWLYNCNKQLAPSCSSCSSGLPENFVRQHVEIIVFCHYFVEGRANYSVPLENVTWQLPCSKHACCITTELISMRPPRAVNGSRCVRCEFNPTLPCLPVAAATTLSCVASHSDVSAETETPNIRGSKPLRKCGCGRREGIHVLSLSLLRGGRKVAQQPLIL
jgi:hypothetical protein